MPTSVRRRVTSDPFECLRADHRQIERALCVLERLARAATRDLAVDRDELAIVVAYFVEFGDLGHHEKEESILTPSLLDHGFGWFDEPVASVRREHRQVRSLVGSLDHLVRQSTAWSREDARQFASLALEYVRFSRDHMHREEELFARAARRFSREVNATIMQRFESFESALRCSADYRAAVVRMERLIGRFAPDEEILATNEIDAPDCTRNSRDVLRIHECATSDPI